MISEIQAGLFTEAGQLTGAGTCIENGDYIYVDAEMTDGVFAMKVRRGFDATSIPRRRHYRN